MTPPRPGSLWSVRPTCSLREALPRFAPTRVLAVVGFDGHDLPDGSPFAMVEIKPPGRPATWLPLVTFEETFEPARLDLEPWLDVLSEPEP